MALDRDLARRHGAPFVASGIGADDLLVETTGSVARHREIMREVQMQAISENVAFRREA
jgi:hypothetical protein